MRVTRVIELDDLKVTVKELTVAEVRAWLVDLTAPKGSSVDVVSALLFEESDLTDILRMTDLPAEQLDALPPSELEKILAVCQQLNSHFFSLRRRLYEQGKAAMALQQVSGNSKLASADSAALATAMSGNIPGGSILPPGRN